MAWPALLAIAALIAWGSLYPFAFEAPTAPAWQGFLSPQRWTTSRGDMLSNIALFVPFGAAMAAIAAGARLPWRAPVAVLAGAAFALLLQVLQLALPDRDPQLADVLFNTLGSAFGVGLHAWLRREGPVPTAPTIEPPAGGRDRRALLLLLALAVGALWVPGVPSLDVSALKDQARELLGSPLRGDDLATGAALALFGLALASRLWPAVPPMAFAAAAVLGVPAGQLLIPGSPTSPGLVLGLAAGAAAGWRATGAAASTRPAAMALVLLALYTAGGLWPWALADGAAPMRWVPFDAVLRRTSPGNVAALATDAMVLVAVLWFAREAGARVRAVALALAAWVLLVELAQTRLPGRTADVTPAVLALAAGGVLALLREPPSLWRLRPGTAGTAAAPPGPAAAPAPSAEPRRAGTETPALAAIGGAVGGAATAALVLALAVSWLLGQPRIPYNVRELFRGEGAFAALFAFGLALLSFGAGSAWVAQALRQARHAAAILPGAVLVAATASLALMALAVTGESLADVAGSTNRWFFVVERGEWGPLARAAFEAVGRPPIDFVERVLRWAALVGPLFVAFGVALAFARGEPAWRPSPARAVALAASAALVLWACKWLAFDASSTDNLNELIARDGPLGLGGGPALYALLGSIVGSALLLARALAPPLSPRRASTALAAGLLALPLGWWLLNQGLEPEVRKYGEVFSGAQFLLGPDRETPLPEAQLALRWVGVQAVAVLLLAIGAVVGERALAARAPRPEPAPG
jgi:VanZ family protein